MNPRTITPDDLAYWDELNPTVLVFAADDEYCQPCPAVATDDPTRPGGRVVRVAWQLDEIDLAHLARGGTLWLSTWGGLPMHSLDVQEP